MVSPVVMKFTLPGRVRSIERLIKNLFGQIDFKLTSGFTTTADTTYDNDDLDDAIFVRSFGFFVRFFVFVFVRKFSKNRSRRCDDFGQKLVKIRAILAIFRPFKDFDAVR